MKSYCYRGLEKEHVPQDVTHIIINEDVRVIKKYAFEHRYHLVSVIMGNKVETIETGAFCYCTSLKIITLSKVLKFIGRAAFQVCRSLQIVVLPSTVRKIEDDAFVLCWSLRLLVLPATICLRNVGKRLIHEAALSHIAEAVSCVSYEWRCCVTNESNRRVNQWLVHCMDDSPFHKLCYRADVSVSNISEYLKTHGNDSARRLDIIYGMTPLHVLAMNPHASADILSGTLLGASMEAVCYKDRYGKIPLDYAFEYNVPGLLKMVEALCLHRQSTSTAVSKRLGSCRKG